MDVPGSAPRRLRVALGDLAGPARLVRVVPPRLVLTRLVLAGLAQAGDLRRRQRPRRLVRVRRRQVRAELEAGQIVLVLPRLTALLRLERPGQELARLLGRLAVRDDLVRQVQRENVRL